MTSQQAEHDLEDDGSGFNPIEFARKLFASIRPFRSQLSSQPNILIVSPLNVGSAGQRGENLVNAFFRMLGLPASRSEDFLTSEGNEELLAKLTSSKRVRDSAFSQDHTLNYFASIGEVTAGREVISDINSRNDKLSTAPTSSDFNKLMESPLSFDESIKPTGSRRVSIFPLVSDAAVPIYPLSRRIAPFFNDGDYIINSSRTRLSRPFIEHVIYIRSKALSGNSSSELTTELLARINAFRPESEEEFTDLGSFSDIELIIQQRFLQALRKLAFDYLKIREEANISRQTIKFIPRPVTNPEERSGQGTLPTEEINADASAPGLDQRINALKLALAKEEAIRFILPTDRVNRSDKIRRLEDRTVINDFKDDALISDFTNLLTYKEDDLNRQIAEVAAERRRALQEAEKLKRDLIYFTGEFTGLSIFDVIGVLYGLFTIETKYLIGLMNADAQHRLLDDPFFAFGPAEQSSSEISQSRNPANLLSSAQGGAEPIPSVSESLTELQRKVEEAFLLAKTFASQDGRRPVRRRGITCR